VRCFAALLLGLQCVVLADWAGAASALRDAFTIAESLGPADQDLLPNLGIAALQLSDDDRALRYHSLLLARAQNTGAVLMVRYAFSRLAFSQIATGQWAAAAAGVDTAINLARQTGEPALAAQPLAFRTLLAAYRNDPGYDSHLAEIQGIIADAPLGILQALIKDVVRWAQGAREAAQGSPSFHHLAQMNHHITRGMAAIDRLEAALHAGRADTAAHDIAQLERFSAATGSPWAAAAAAHGHALLTHGDGAERHFLTALDHHAASPRLDCRCAVTARCPACCGSPCASAGI
jgi:hypothetical protein